MNSSWFHCMFSSLYPELCYAGHLKCLSVKLKFIIYCRSCGQQHSDHVNFNSFTLNVNYLAKNSLHPTFSGHLRNYDCKQSEIKIVMYQIIYTGMFWLKLHYICHWVFCFGLCHSKFDNVNSTERAVAFLVWELQCWWIKLALGNIANKQTMRYALQKQITRKQKKI